MDDHPTGEVTDLLAHLIRNGCVNEGVVASGHENRSADLLRTYLEGPGCDVVTYEPAPGRTSLLARIEGSDPDAPGLMLMGHTDVVPVSAERWRRDPFGGEVVDGEVWGRGAVDMLNLTSSMAVAFRSLARSGFRPRGTLSYLAVADEEALGTWGADWLLDHEADDVATDFVLTEPGGVTVETPEGLRLPVTVGEKGTYWVKLHVGGTPGHGSRPYRTDNALVTAAEVVTRLAGFRPTAQISEAWRRWVRGSGMTPDVAAGLVDPDRVEATLERLPTPMARLAHACTHTTFAPTVAHGGQKTNVIPDRVDLEVDIRTLPGQTGPEVAAMLAEALGDLADRVEIELVADDPATDSPMDTPLWDCLSRVTSGLVPGTGLLPSLCSGATDSRFFRRHGSVAYGFGLLSRQMSFEQYEAMFHGDDERVDVESLALSVSLWERVARDFLA